MKIRRPTDPNVVLFCGGRGSASIIRELIVRPRIRLSLLVNAYDDGLSTGALRDFITGMLGPSDFRKNLSYLLDLYSAQQYALQQLLEYRLPTSFDQAIGDELHRFARTRRLEGLPASLRSMLSELDRPVLVTIAQFLLEFLDYAEAKDGHFDYADCSFGNLIFAGAYLKTGGFNAATRELARLCASQAELINVSQGECRTLVALKEDGQILPCEAEIVGKQSPVPIRSIFFFERRPTPAELAEIADQTLPEKEAWLKARQTDVQISDEARQALEKADIIIYGPGTQHSSLLPSYRIAADAIQRSPALVKSLVVNLREDHDIPGLRATDLVNKVLTYLGDPENQHGVVTHFLYNKESNTWTDGTKQGDVGPTGFYRGARMLADDFRNPVKPAVHNGFVLVNKILTVFEDSGQCDKPQALDIYVDLLGRLTGLDPLLQEFLELSWTDYFQHVRLRVNHLSVPAVNLPAHLQVETTNYLGEHTESLVLRQWVMDEDSDYLATITGDGEYRLRDVLFAANLIKGGSFGAVFGSRIQSRRQLRSLLRSAYGEGGILYRLSRSFAVVLTSLYFLRFGLIFSDPLTGFRVYKRARMHPDFVAAMQRHSPLTIASATNILIKNKVEIAEIPIVYRTFSGFTKPAWRTSRALRNLRGFFFGY